MAPVDESKDCGLFDPAADQLALLDELDRRAEERYELAGDRDDVAVAAPEQSW